MGELVIPPILLVRFKPCLPDGTVVDESDRVCHLVILPGADGVVPVLRAYCGVRFAPGSAQWLQGIAGAPCEVCLDRVPLPSVAVLRLVRSRAPSALVEAEPDRVEQAAWWSLALEPERQVIARCVLLVLLQDPARPVAIATVSDVLGEDRHTVSRILLLQTAIGWVKRIPPTDPCVWTDRSYQLTTLGATSARRLLADGSTPTLTALAGGLGLDAKVVHIGSDGVDPKPGQQHFDEKAIT